MVSLDGEDSAALARVARQIHGDDELDQLLDLIGEARVVLLGEATHGSHEFYELRAALTRKLIGQRGFAAVAIEGDWPDALRVDRYIRSLGDDDTADEALGAFQRFPTWMWRNTDVAALVEWLRHHNGSRGADGRVGFYGLDLYSLHASIRAVLSYLGDNDADAAGRARSRYACFDHADQDPQQYGMKAHLEMSSSCEREVIEQLVEMQRRHAARSGRAPSGDSWFHAMQNAHVVKDAEAYYRTMFGGRNASWNLRDTHMADTLDMLAEHLGTKGDPAKLVVWAHNSHVGDARATELGDSGQLSLGQLMRQRHPDEVALVGFTTHTGTVECAYDWDEPGAVEDVRPSLPGSWEELFHEIGIPRFMITSSALRRVVGDEVTRLHRAIGVVYRPKTERRSHYYDARLADQYDLIVHVDETSAVEPLEPDDKPVTAREAHELPETYPTGM
ncbi:MAG: erythromycin esterase family protein [Deltaproteobacteria bacterium]|nr:erythromycin esterase family protein [Deltaproteobacteria bacterium]MDQ3297587.1 erythromycin esterase family protein [Myxococcota bacterium]